MRDLNELKHIECTINGRTKTLGEWAEIQQLKKEAILARLDRGWTAHQAFTLPLHWCVKPGWRNKKRKK